MKKSGAIAILAHWRTGSNLLRDTLAACGMKEYIKELGIGHGDINGIGNSLCNGFPIDGDPIEIVSNALIHFKKVAESKEWKHYGVKVDHTLQSACWNEVGKQFESHWPDARYVISIRHPAGIIRSIEKLRKTVKLEPDFTVQEIIESYLSTYEATKYLIEKKDALVVVYANSYIDGSIKKVINELGLRWTKAAGELFDATTLDDCSAPLFFISDEEHKYLKAVEMFEELKECAVKPSDKKNTSSFGDWDVNYKRTCWTQAFTIKIIMNMARNPGRAVTRTIAGFQS